jgi:hypothetical protein
MVFLDSNIFVIDRFFPRDTNFPLNRRFLDVLDSLQAERYVASAIATWNTKDFARRTSIPIYTLATYLQRNPAT